VVDAFPYAVLGETAEKSDSMSYPDDACAGEAKGAGDAAPDQVYVFTAPDDGAYTVSLSSQNFDSALYVVADCNDVAGTCLAADEQIGDGKPEAVDLTLTAGAVIFIVVDGWGDGEVGSYMLEIHGAGCDPDCQGKQCGPDGCGGSCGACADAEQCTNTGKCVALSGGCPNASPVAQAPVTLSGDTSVGDQVLGYGNNACPGETTGWGAASPEQVYAFTPPAPGVYTMTLTAEYDSNLYVVTDCADVDGTCLAADEQIGTGKPETVIVDLGGDTVYVVVDGWGGGAAGPYELEITPGGCAPACAGKKCGDDGCGGVCGECADDQTCETGQCIDIPTGACPDTITVGPLPYVHNGDTTGSLSELGYSTGACPPESGGWGADAPEQVYAFKPAASGKHTITLTAEYDSNLYIVEDCADVDGTCLGADEQVGAGKAETVTVTLSAGDWVFIVVDGWGADVSGAYTLTVESGEPPVVEDTCCDAQEGPGCSLNAACQQCVCDQDAFCCDNKWDSLCADAAQDPEKCETECGCSSCVAQCAGKSCGDNGCGGSCGTCAAGKVCNPDGACVDSSGDLCDDANECTLDIPVPTLGCLNIPVGAPGCAANIVITSPARAASLKGPAGVTAKGKVTVPGGSIKSFKINGKTATVDASGNFSVALSPKVGLNVLDVRVTTALNGEQAAVRAYTWAPEYHGVGASIPTGASLYTSKTVWDDNDTSDIDDLATVVTLIIENADIAGSVPNPLGTYKVGWCTYTIKVKSFSIGDPVVDLKPVNGALRTIVTFPDLKTDLKAEGAGFACIDASPKVTADSMQVSLDMAITAQADGNLTVTMANEKATVKNLDIKLSGVAGFLFNWIFNFFEGTVADNIEEQVVGQLSQFPQQLSAALEKIAVTTDLDIPGFLGPPTTLKFIAKLSGADFDETGGYFDVGASLTPFAKKTPHMAPGSVLRKGCGGSSGAFSFLKQGQIEFAINDDLANQALFALWWGGAFEGAAPASVTGGVDLSEYEVDVKALDVSFMLPPVISDCDPGKGLVLGLGDIKIDASVEIFGVQTVDLTAWASVRVAVKAVVQSGAAGKEVGLKLGKLLFTGVEMDTLPEDMAGVKPALEFLILEHVIPPMLDDLGGGVLAAIPVPEIPLDGFSAAIPAGTAVSLDLKSVYRKGGRTVLSGDAE